MVDQFQHYTPNGTIWPNKNRLYCKRQADIDLMNFCQKGLFVYVLNTRQVGKSSLLVHTSEQLKKLGILSVYIDLTGVTGRSNATAEQFFVGIIDIIYYTLNLKVSADDWWDKHPQWAQVQCFVSYLKNIVLPDVKTRVVIFIDEIDFTLGLPFASDFFAAIRHLHNTENFTEKISFVLSGAATPEELIADPTLTPFNIGKPVELTDFNFDEAVPLALNLHKDEYKAQQLLKQILTWTNGHPYLTQKLCIEVAKQTNSDRPKENIDETVKRLFLKLQNDDNLSFVQKSLTQRPSEEYRRAVLNTYGSILLSQIFPWGRESDEEQSIVKSHLKLAGIVRREKGFLEVRNRIYRKKFGFRWLLKHTSLGKWWAETPSIVKQSLGLTALLLVLLVVVTNFVFIQQFAIANEREKVEQQSLLNEQQGLLSKAISIAESGNKTDIAALLSIQAYQVGHNSNIGSMSLTDSILRRILNQPYFNIALRGHLDQIYGVVFDTEDNKLVSTGNDGFIHLWSLTNLKSKPESYICDGEPLKAISISTANRLLAVGDVHGTICVWKMENIAGQPTVLIGNQDEIHSLAFRPDGLELASGSADHSILRWNLSNLSDVPPPTPLLGHKYSILALAYNNDGATLISADRESVRQWQLQGPEIEVANIFTSSDNSNIETVAVHDATNKLAVGSSDRRIYLVDLTKPGTKVEELTGHTSAVNSVTFSQDGSEIFSGSDDQTIRIWKVDSSSANSVVLNSPGTPVRFVASSTDGKILASIHESSDDAIQLWFRDGFPKTQPVQVGEYGSPIRSTAFINSHEGAFAALTEDSNIFLEDIGKKRFTSIHIPLREGEIPPESLAFSLSTQQIVTYKTSLIGSVTLLSWNVSNMAAPQLSKQIILHGRGSNILSGVLDEEGQMFGVIEPTSVSVWRIGEKMNSPIIYTEEASFLPFASFSSDHQWLATGHSDKKIRLWSLSSPTMPPIVLDANPIFSTNYNQKLHIRLAFSPNNSMLAAASDQGNIGLWTLNKLDESPKILYGSTEDIYGLAFSHDNKTLAAAGKDLIIRLWKLEKTDDPITLMGHGSVIKTISFSADDKYFISAGNDKMVRSWIYDTDSLVQQACEGLARNLTREEWQVYFGKYIEPGPCPDLIPSLVVTTHETVAKGAIRKRIEDEEIAKLISPEALGLSDEVVACTEHGAKPDTINNFIANFKENFPPSKNRLKALGIYWNNLCLCGSIWGHADQVIAYCDLSIKLNPTDGNGYHSRGVARALAGDYQRAAQDLRFFLQSDKRENQDLYKNWIDVLNKQMNPIGPDCLEEIQSRNFVPNTNVKKCADHK